MAETILLRGARQLVTLHGPPEARRGQGLADLNIISDGALLIQDGVIQEVGMTRRVENLAAARRARVIEATGRVVMPAFVDSGVSLVFAHNATDQNDTRMQSGLPQTAAGQREDILEAMRVLRQLSKKSLIPRAARIAREMRGLGTGTVCAVSGYGLDETGEMKLLRVLEAIEEEGPHMVPAFFGGNMIPSGVSSTDYWSGTLSPLMPVLRQRGLAAVAALRCAPGGLDLLTARKYLEAARELGMHRAIYAQQFASDQSVGLAIEMGALSLTHLEQISDEDIPYLAKSRVAAVLTPAATCHMGLTRFAPARKLIEAGAAVGLATAFSPEQNPSFSMPYTISLACRYLGMSAAEAITAATLNAAYAIGRGTKTGSLAHGKQADLIILNARDYREIPQAPGVNLVDTIMKAGRVVECSSSVSQISQKAVIPV